MDAQTHQKGIKAKPDWDTYFLTLAFLVAQRSIDESSLCGAVIVSKSNKILSQGYNGPISGSNDLLIPQTRPEKYAHFLHAEENALLNFDGSSELLKDATIYITGRSCSRCLRMMVQKGIKRIVYAKNDVRCVDSSDIKEQELMLSYIDKKIEIIEKKNIKDDLCALLSRTSLYIKERSN